MAEHNHNSALFTALASGIAGLGLGAAVGAWWSRRIPGHIYRDGENWYVDEPVRRELQRRIPKSAGPSQNERDTFSLFGHGSIQLAPTQITLPAQSGTLYAVQPMLRPGQTLEWVMLDLAVHRVGTLKLIRYAPRRVEGRMVQGSNPEEPAPPGLDT